MIQSPLDHQPLFSKRLIEKRILNAPIPPSHATTLQNWAATIRNGSIVKVGEEQIRPDFIQRMFIEVLGYVGFGSGASMRTVTHEQRLGAGSADQALGYFSDSRNEVIAPMELKGARTSNLDAIMPGRHKSPVQQVWEYAMDTPGCKFLIVSNMLEIRLYAVGHTRQVYERFDLLEVADSTGAYHKLQLLLGAHNLLGGNTAKLLVESGQQEREITAKLYKDYKTWRAQLILSLAQSNDDKPARFIAAAQKLLDRVLFIAFAEDRGLLEKDTLKRVHHDRGWIQQPLWVNYQGLFRAIDKGLPERNIPPYNGGLFAFDPLVDELTVTDQACELFAAFEGYDFASEVSVTVLGHIFEQSIEDLEKLNQLAADGVFTEEALTAEVERASATNVSGKRKLDGVVFTPAFITEFIVEQTLGRHLRERRAAVLTPFLAEGSSPDDAELSYRAASKDELARFKKLKGAKKADIDPNRVVEYLFLDVWRDALTDIKVCDPACGSGAFLVAAFDLLDAEYKRVSELTQAITGTFEMFDIDRDILNGNLYGVDINEESIEISKLSLWLKTAKRGKTLHSLEANLRVGNSVISPTNGGDEYSPRAFDWATAFPEIMARGGFDVVIGNPPYVRMEHLKPIKPYLEKHFKVASDRADLYCYFFELGVNLLRPGGRMGYISSSTFFKTGSGEALRQFLLDETTIESVIDFGDLQVFEGVTTYPATITVRRAKRTADDDARIRFLALTDTLPANLAAEFVKHGQTMPQARLGAGSWQLESDALSALRAKLSQGRKTLKEVYGSPLYGIKTGLNEAFVVDSATRDALVRDDPKSADLLKPFLEGKDLQRWRVESQGLWIIYTPRNAVDIDRYPAIKAHLAKYKVALEKRATKQAWFELQQAQAAYAEAMQRPKLIYTRFMDRATFAWDAQGHYVNNALNFANRAGLLELALLNSQLCWFWLQDVGSVMRGGYVQVHGHVLESLPIPDFGLTAHDLLSQLAQAASTAAENRKRGIDLLAHEILRDLAPGGLTSKLPSVLQEWPSLDFAAFRAAVKKHFKQDIPQAERNDWEAKLIAGAKRVSELTAEIAVAEREIDQIVYRLFDLTPDEIALIEASVA